MPIASALMGLFLLSGGAVAAPARASAPAAPVVPTYPVTLTGYNAVPGQTDDTPFETAAGTFSNPEIVAARSRDLADRLPFGTIIEIIGPEEPSRTCGYGIVEPVIGYRIIEDTMNPRYTDRIDVLFGTESNYVMADGRSKNAGTILGICDGVRIRVVGKINVGSSDRPKTQRELAAFVRGTESALVRN